MCPHITSTPKISKLNVDLGHIEQLFHQNVLARFGDLGDPNHQNPEQGMLALRWHVGSLGEVNKNINLGYSQDQGYS